MGEEGSLAEPVRRTSASGAGIGASGEPKIEAICDSCGKKTYLNFEPDLNRAIYCKDCLTKIKAGEMAPVKVNRQAAKAASNASRYSADLANMGIEFESRPPAAAERQSNPSQPKGMPKSAISTMQPIKTSPPANASPLSLSDLKPLDKSPKNKPAKPEIDIAELRQAINASLKEDTAEPPPNLNNQA